MSVPSDRQGLLDLDAMRSLLSELIAGARRQNDGATLETLTSIDEALLRLHLLLLNGHRRNGHPHPAEDRLLLALGIRPAQRT